ncbi:flagellar motor protein MotB [Albimonas sp. CAU 1670]|uniref:flagellar motor protein MotB n=1 Tax=Albimonas sp. CAU 1670 TaxID=3032599 RepID=UPI0023DB50AF|nr:flagellar motor protein MotB [Albimonas sp. CAU 1670]MDF2231131.1 flagellar motor protein MotB [Albimonas sp. CAU 1670]
MADAAMIVKRKKVVGGDGHHGGAWKVAYADFVTAMMAFFLLMWLLNATTEEQRAGLAEYFDPRVPIAKISGGGTGAFGGDSMFSESTMSQNGTGASAQNPMQNEQSKGDTGTLSRKGDEGSAQELTELDNLFRGMTGESEAADELLQHIKTRVTDEGLVIELFDVDGKPLFRSGSAEPTPQMTALLEMVGGVARLVTNRIAITGHTDASPFAADAPYGNWELSTDRAQVTRRALGEAGVEVARMARVTGKADTEPAPNAALDDPRNRRVQITLLRNGS